MFTIQPVIQMILITQKDINNYRIDKSINTNSKVSIFSFIPVPTPVMLLGLFTRGILRITPSLPLSRELGSCEGQGQGLSCVWSTFYPTQKNSKQIYQETILTRICHNKQDKTYIKILFHSFLNEL